MIHYVKEAKKEAFKTVERFASKKNNRLTFWALQTCEGLLPYCKLVNSGKHGRMDNDNGNIVNFYIWLISFIVLPVSEIMPKSSYGSNQR